jgi:ABC-type transport system involved in cytochrome c biogenesis permease subunit
MYTVTPLRVIAMLLFYLALLTIIRVIKPRIEPEERRTAIAIGVTWAVPVFIANYLLYRADLMSFLPWVTNFMHTFLWIGIILTFLYLGVRTNQSMFTQIVLFTTFSLIVKYAEQIVFGTWDQDNFFHVFHGNGAYILGWSLADGTYPILTLYGLRLASRWIPGLQPT